MAGFFKKVRFEEGKIVKDHVVEVADALSVVTDSACIFDLLDEPEMTNTELDNSIEQITKPKPVGYYAITDDPYEMTVDKIVRGLKSELCIYGDVALIENAKRGIKMARAELSDAYDQVSVMCDRVNELIQKYLNSVSYYDYKKENRFSYMTRSWENLNLKYEVEYSTLLEKSLVSSGLVREMDVAYVFNNVRIIFEKMKRTEADMLDAIKDMDVVKDAYYSTKVLGTELEMFGRYYKMTNKLNVNRFIENVNDEFLPDVKVVITETGVHLLWDIKLDTYSNMKVTSEGYIYYRYGSEWKHYSGSSLMNRRMSYVVGNITQLIRKKLGMNVKVQAVGLVSNPIEHIDNLSSRKVITLANLYDTVYEDTGGSLLSEEDMDDVYKLIESMNVENDVVEFADITNDLKTWENNLKWCAKLLDMRVYIRNFERNGEI